MITYDLAAGRRLSAPPQVRYTDRVEEWAILCTGRDLRPAVSWRATVATARKIDPATIIAETDTGITATENTVLVPLDVFFAPFRNAVATAEKGRDLWFALWGKGADGKEAEYIEFQFTGFPAIDPPGEPPKQLPIRPTTTVNGLSGAVTLADADGVPLPASDGVIPLNAAAVGLENVENILDNLTATAAPTATADSAAGYAVGSRWIDVAHGKSYTCIKAEAAAAVWTEGGGGTVIDWDYSQVTWPAAVDAARGRVRNLDATLSELIFAEVQDITGFRAMVVGTDPVVTGDIVIVPVVASDIDFTDAEELPAMVVPVGLSLAWIERELPVAKKFLKFRRDYADARDTLHDGGGTPLTAIITKLGVR